MDKMYFIVGTGTEIGKTYCTVRILEKEMQNKKKVIVLKPVETGSEIFGENFRGSDSWKYASILNKDIEDINLYFLKKPYSPHLAAQVDGIKIKKEKIIEFIRQKSKEYDIIYIEGAGGLIVPFDDDFTYLDIISEYKDNAQVIIIVDNKLGSINEVMLTIDVLKNKGITIKGIVYNVMEEGRDLQMLEDNKKTIFRLSGVGELIHNI